jgi:hypothetical protein
LLVCGTTATDPERVQPQDGIAGPIWSEHFAAALPIVLVTYPPSPRQFPPSWLASATSPLAYNNHQQVWKGI